MSAPTLVPSAEPDAAAQPSTSDRFRFVGVDAARGVALVGMMAVHSLPLTDDDGNATWSYFLFGGRAAATFALLAGLAVAFSTGRARVGRAKAASTAAALTTRALAIGAIGLALGHTDARLAVVMLPYYAVLFLLAIPLVFLPTWLVGAVGLLTATGMPVLSHLLLPLLPPATPNNPGIEDLAGAPVRLLTELTLTGEYPALTWLTYLCFGLVIGRLPMSRLRVATGLVVTGAFLAVGAASTSWWLLHEQGGLDAIRAAQPESALSASTTEALVSLGGDGTSPTSTWWWLAVGSPHMGTTPDVLGTAGAAMALLGVMLLLARLRNPGVLRVLVLLLQKPLAAAGSMTLTFYSAHVLFLNSPYYDGKLPGYLGQVAVVLLLGLAWRLTAGRGPLEGAVAALTTTARTLVTPRGRST